MRKLLDKLGLKQFLTKKKKKYSKKELEEKAQKLDGLFDSKEEAERIREEAEQEAQREHRNNKYKF